MGLMSYKKELFASAVLLALFALSSFYSQQYVAEISEFMSHFGAYGMLFYVLLAMVATVIAPISFLPLLPVAVTLWGSLATALLSILAWALGAAIAFLLARRFGKPLVKYFIGKKKMDVYANLVPQKYMFFAIVMLRMFLPVDLLSYALGLFGVVRFWKYMLATIIGITPFAFIFAYVAEVDVRYQILLFVFGVLLFALSLPYLKRRYQKLFLER